MSCLITGLPISAKEKSVIYCVKTKNRGKTSMIEQKPGLVSTPGALEGKLNGQLAATKSLIKFVIIDWKFATHLHGFMKSVVTNLKPTTQV